MTARFPAGIVPPQTPSFTCMEPHGTYLTLDARCYSKHATISPLKKHLTKLMPDPGVGFWDPEGSDVPCPQGQVGMRLTHSGTCSVEACTRHSLTEDMIGTSVKDEEGFSP